uniref:Uncharacterized protein n=1 Tax=Opuntia streptacantha TaxID=393608 RepID=A0A7C8YTJ2_OPUST
MNLGGVPHCSGNGHGWFPLSKKGSTPTPAYLLTTTVSLSLGRMLHRHLLHCRISLLDTCSLTVAGIFKQKSHNLRQFNLLQWSNDAISAACSSCLCFFGGNPSRKETRAEGGSSQEISRRSPSSQRRWTNVLLAVNVLVYVAQIATQGKLMLWGAKVRSQNRNYR